MWRMRREEIVLDVSGFYEMRLGCDDWTKEKKGFLGFSWGCKMRCGTKMMHGLNYVREIRLRCFRWYRWVFEMCEMMWDDCRLQWKRICRDDDFVLSKDVNLVVEDFLNGWSIVGVIWVLFRYNEYRLSCCFDFLSNLVLLMLWFHYQEKRCEDWSEIKRRTPTVRKAEKRFNDWYSFLLF